MDPLSQAVSGTLQSVLVAVATVAILALLRLITPTVRWNRRLKRDMEIYSALPDGKEKELWATSVTAQAERLRIYREDLSIGDQIFAWYAFSAVTITPIALISDSNHGWFAVSELSAGSVVGAILFVIVLTANFAFAVVVTVRLIRGQSTALRDGSGGHYPKFYALRRAERRRKAKRAAIERRLARAQNPERPAS